MGEVSLGESEKMGGGRERYRDMGKIEIRCDSLAKVPTCMLGSRWIGQLPMEIELNDDVGERQWGKASRQVSQSVRLQST